MLDSLWIFLVLLHLYPHNVGQFDIGREYAFTGSEKASKHVINNLLQQHFWATNAALRNNANYKAAQQVALHNENNELSLSYVIWCPHCAKGYAINRCLYS